MYHLLVFGFLLMTTGCASHDSLMGIRSELLQNIQAVHDCEETRPFVVQMHDLCAAPHLDIGACAAEREWHLHCRPPRNSSGDNFVPSRPGVREAMMTAWHRGVLYLD